MGWIALVVVAGCMTGPATVVESGTPDIPTPDPCVAVANDIEPVGEGVYDRWIRTRVTGPDASTARLELVEVQGDERLPVAAQQSWDPEDVEVLTLEPDAPLSPNRAYELRIDFCDGRLQQASAFRTNDVGPVVEDFTALDGTHWRLDLEQGIIDELWANTDYMPIVTVRAPAGGPVGLDLSYYARQEFEWHQCPYRYELTVENDSPWLLTDDIGPPLGGGNFPSDPSLQLRCAIGTDPLRVDSCDVEGLVTREGTIDCVDDWLPCDPCPWSPDNYDIICLPNRIRNVPAEQILGPPQYLLDDPICAFP